MSQPNQDSVYVNHLVSQIHSNLSVLVSQGKISNTDATVIKAKLPAISSPETARNSRASAFPIPSSAPPPPHEAPVEYPAPQPSPVVVNSSQPQPHHGSDIHRRDESGNVLGRSANDGFKRARALWNYTGSAADDLSFNKGDVIIILAEENADWWKGEIVGSQSGPGLFPSNHVEVMPTPPEPNSSARAPPGAGYSAPSGPPNPYQASYAHQNPPPPSHYPPPGPNYQNGPPQSYGPAPNQWQAPPYSYQGDYKPPPLEHSQSAPPTQVAVEKPKKKPFQGRLGQAFVGGAGFGAGSAVASNLVNAIL